MELDAVHQARANMTVSVAARTNVATPHTPAIKRKKHVYTAGEQDLGIGTIGNVNTKAQTF